MEVARSCETLVSYIKTMWYHNPQEINLYLHYHENLKSHICTDISVSLWWWYNKNWMHILRNSPSTESGELIGGWVGPRPSLDIVRRETSLPPLAIIYHHPDWTVPALFLNMAFNWPSNLKGGFCSINNTFKSCSFCNEGQSQHTQVVGYQDDINFWEVNYFRLRWEKLWSRVHKHSATTFLKFLESKIKLYYVSSKYKRRRTF